MCIVGFGYLMCFMKNYNLSAVGLSFLVTIIAIPLQMNLGQFFAMILPNDDYPVELQYPKDQWLDIQTDMNALLQGDFAAAAVLISLGAVIGKVSPAQVALMTMLEILF